MNDTELKNKIMSALKEFGTASLHEASVNLLNTLGYDSDKRVDTGDMPEEFLELLRAQAPKEFDESQFTQKTFFREWESASLLFQLAGDDITEDPGRSDKGKIDTSNMQSYVFFAVSLSGKDYPRGALAKIARQINRVFPMPVMVLISYENKLTMAIINRRLDKRKHLDRDVLEKVTLIKDIDLRNPHRAHIEILFDFSIEKLRTSQQVATFNDLHAVWTEILNVEALNKKFYKRIQEWFFLASQKVKFPHGGIDDEDVRNRTALIRLLTRIVFCWFAKEKGLIPESLFDPATSAGVLKRFEPLSGSDGSYYKAILQNLFFPTLSIPLDQREFRNGRRYKGVNKHYMRHEFFRHEAMFKDHEDLGRLFSGIPFLNGGLFECLDSGTCKENELRVDGFSDVADNQPLVPNILFFGKDIEADLSSALGSDKKSSVKVDGLFRILEAYKFTISENTPVEEEIALDPELLGRIFENLLAEYNPETMQTARKQTGSFYTPRNIVDYMVDESLKAYLKQTLCSKSSMKHEDADTGLEILFNYTEKQHPFNENEKLVLVDSIYDIKVLDPACGSGAFPMGMLHKLVYVLEKLDTGHERWKKRILDETPVEMREETKKLLNRSSADHNWKLGLVLHSIYGVDIQPIAVQIAKLRCFISLLVDFPVDENAENKGVPALPNLDFKFVAANTLIKPPSAIERDDNELGFEDEFFTKFAKAAESYFFVRDPEQKRLMRIEIEKLIDGKIRESEGTLAGQHGNKHLLEDKSRKAFAEKNRQDIERVRREIELWESYRNIFAFRNKHVEFFDTRYFFPEVKDGFDIVIGNPPYVQIQNYSGTRTQKYLEDQEYETFVKTGDIYCLFYERGCQILADGCILTYISSNKWMRANYGKPMRKYFLEHGTLARLIDFGDSRIFENATTYTNIAIWHKGTNEISSKAWDLSKAFEIDASLEEILKKEGECEALFNEASFVLVKGEQASIKKQIEKAGVPLKEWDIQIYRGILTGFNEAFIIDGKKKDELIANDSKCAEIIKPILRGRDIKRYKAEFADLWVIIVKFGSHVLVKTKYPVIYNHLLNYKSELENRGQCRYTSSGKPNPNAKYPGQHHWVELDNNPKDEYLALFEKEKILYAEIVVDSAFYYDTQSFFPEATTFIITGERIKYLTALLNSKLLTYAFKTFYAGGDLRGNTFRYKKVFIENLPVPKITINDQKPFEALVDDILAAKKENSSADTSELEKQIDQLVYQLYGMTEDEIKIVERAI